MTAGLAALLAAMAGGVLIADAAVPQLIAWGGRADGLEGATGAGWPRRLLVLGVGGPVGLVSTSLLAFFWASVGGELSGAYFGFEAAVLVIVASAAVWTKRAVRASRSTTSPDHTSVPRSARANDVPPWLLGVAGVAFGVSLVAFGARQIPAPYGGQDGVGIWNLHARVLARGGPDALHFFRDSPRDGFATAFHTDYPLMLPASIARLWSAAGRDDPRLSACVALVFYVSLLAIMAGLVGMLRTPLQGVLATLPLLGTPYVVLNAADQYADVPLGCLLLAGVGLVAMGGNYQWQRSGAWWLAGFCLAGAAWTKNEGLLALAAACGAQLLLAGFECLPAGRRLLREAAGGEGSRGIAGRGWLCSWGLAGLGAAPVVAGLMLFKLSYAGSNNLTAGQSVSETWERLADVERYGLVLMAFPRELWELAKLVLMILPVYAALVGVCVRPGRGGEMATVGLTCGLLAAAFAGVYLVTPEDLPWHLETSLRRLLLQIWPSAILALFLATRVIGGETEDGVLPQKEIAGGG